MNDMLPKTILFDLDDTILAYSASTEACWQSVCALYAPRLEGFTPAGLYAAIRKSSDWYWSDAGRHKRGRLNMRQARREVVASAFRALDIQEPNLADEMADAFSCKREQAITLFPGAVETLRALCDRGLPLGLITNGSAEDQKRKISRFGLGGFFKCILIEGEVGVGKPDTQVYALALERMGTGPEGTWMVGDNLEWDIQAPQKIGIKAIWVDIAGKGLPAGSSIQPDRIIRSITELAG